ncbi:MAG: PASTA domain-containing protein [Salinibacter sp.]
MSVRSRFWSAVEWLRLLGGNRYFWGGMGVLFVFGLCVYLVVDGVIMPSYTRHNVSIQVPNVENLPYEQAKARLSKRDLQVQRQVGRYNPNVDTGIVVDQTPLPSSRVKPGRRVYLTVNSGTIPIVKLPDLTGMSVREARNRVTSLGLEVGTVQEDPIPSPYANTITKQEPVPGDSLQRGKPVDLWYSTGLGETQVNVPNVVGQTVEVARQFLLQRELRSVVVDTSIVTNGRAAGDAAPDSSAKELFVRRQGRSPGTSVRAGTEVRLFTTTDSEAADSLRRDALDTGGTAGPDTTGQ